ncbi:MAG: hypothetical protein ABW352_21360 [Polyangiales bacterium]
MRSIDKLLLAGLATFTGCVFSYGFSGSGGIECAEFTCLWQTEQGSIEETGSWHKDALAHRLVGTPARITRKVDMATFPDCMRIDLTANVAPDAQFELQLDYGNDGSIDTRIPLEPGEWTRRNYYVRTPSAARHLRTSLAKLGPGEAAIEDIRLLLGREACAGQPPTTLGNDSTCLDDASCTSGYCVLGRCSPCGPGGCAEGSACRADKDCMGGACAAGVCRACAASGSCGKGEGCSADSQCAAGSCAFGIKPSLVRYPEQDGVCGECNGDDDCPSGKCVLGQCGDCATDAECSNGQRCRYTDAFEADRRTCVPRFDAILPRGALCEVDAECIGGSRCGAPAGRVKRCGYACRTSSDCAAGEVCGEEGSVPGAQASIYELLPRYAKNGVSRIRTCYAIPVQQPFSNLACEINAQCKSSSDPRVAGACCQGSCSSTTLDVSTDECQQYSSASWDLVNFQYER